MILYSTYSNSSDLRGLHGSLIDVPLAFVKSHIEISFQSNGLSALTDKMTIPD